MCGIAGIWNRKQVTWDTSRVLAAMTDRIRHRGPDDFGHWSSSDGTLHLGHRRLSILDLSPSGHQPMVSERGTVIVFNGEIFNFKEIKERFFPGESFVSTGDTEVLLRLYDKLGEDVVDHLNGMFAFAIWDPAKEELFMARDRTGKKPFYYTFHHGTFAFASEVKALLELPGFERRVEPKALYHFLTFNLLPPPFTFFEGISKLPPAHVMTVGRDGVPRLRRFWTPVYSDLSACTEKQLSDQTYSLLDSAVDYRTLSDVPVGAFLSGGVDSSAVVGMMAARSSRPVRTYSIGFEGQDEYDERKYAAQVARTFGTDHHERVVTADEIREFLPFIVGHFDEPMADATCIPIHFLSQQARADGTLVVLTGDGGDELFAGYRNWMRYAKWYPAFHRYSSLPGWLKRIISQGYQRFGTSEMRYEMLSRSAQNQEFYWGGAKSFKETAKRQILSDAFNRSTAGLDSYEVIDHYRKSFLADVPPSHHDPVDWMCYLGVHFNIPNYYLYRMDRLGMAHSIEIRTPFLDYRLVEHALSIPPSWKQRNGEPKYILKKSLERLLGPDVLYRKKRGFNVPLKEWAGPMLQEYLDANLKSFCNDFPAFRYEGLKMLTERLRHGDREAANRAWTLYFLMNWHRHWIG